MGQILLIPLAFFDVLVIQATVDYVIAHAQAHLLIPLLAVAGSLFLLSITLDAGVQYLAIRLSQYWDATIKSRLLRRVMQKPLVFFQQLPSGDILYRILGDSAVLPQYMTAMRWGFITNAITLIVVAIIIFHYDIALSALLLGVIPFQIILLRRIGNRSRTLQLELKKYDQSLLGYLNSTLTNFESIKAIGIEDRVRHKWIGRYRGRLGTERKLMILQGILGVGVIRLSSLMFLIVLGFGTHRVILGSLTIGELMAFLVVSGRLTKPVQYFANYHLNMQNIMASLQRMRNTWQVHEEMSRPHTAFLLKPGCQSEGLAFAGIDTFELVDVAFSYDRYKAVLQNVTWKIEPGTIYRLSGKNGSGKSTLLKLIARLLVPNQGMIAVNGFPFEEVSFRSLRQNILYLSSDSFWSDGTIEDNLCRGMASHRRPRKDMLTACIEITGCRTFLETMPMGLGSVITSDGKNLSKGEKQRLALTRALLMRPSVLLLDEAMSSMSSNEIPTILNQMKVFLGDASVIIYVLHTAATTSTEEKEIVVYNNTISI